MTFFVILKGCLTFHNKSCKCRTLSIRTSLWDMPEKHIPLIMDIIDNIVSPDSRRRKYSDKQILILLQIFSISSRFAGVPMRYNHSRHFPEGPGRLTYMRSTLRLKQCIQLMKWLHLIPSWCIHTNIPLHEGEGNKVIIKILYPNDLEH